MEEKQLKEFYKKYIDIKIYRVIPEEYIKEIKNEGMNPKKDPLKNRYNTIKKLFKIMKKFEKEGIIYTENWRDRNRKGSEIIKINLKSMKNKHIDFVADYNQATKFKEKWKGGALINSISNYINFLDKQELSSKEKEIIEELKLWIKEKQNYKNVMIYVRGSNKCFEKAKLLLLPINGKIKTIKSPYGSFKHFKKIVKNKFTRYEKYLKQNELSYLRVTSKIPKEAINLIKKENYN